jgi:hypothetical protein
MRLAGVGFVAMLDERAANQYNARTVTKDPK